MNSTTKNDYLAFQKNFWNVDEHTARFGRVDTVSRTEAEYSQLADRDVGLVFSGVILQPGWKVLELGCGVGRLLSRIAGTAGSTRFIGIDIAENMLRFARESLSDFPNVELHVNTGADLSMVGDSSVDFAYSNDVFIHISDVDVANKYFAEIYRVLRPGASFRFNVRRMEVESMFSDSIGGRLAKLGYRVGLLSPLRRRRPGDDGFFGIQYRERDIRKLLGRAGLEVVSLKPFNGVDEQKFWCTCRRA